MEDEIKILISAALAAVDPFKAIQSHLRIADNNLIVRENGEEYEYDLTNKDVRCICIGKGSVPMAKSIDALLGSRIDRGLVITKYDHLGDLKLPDNWECVESAHPVPDEYSLAAGDRIWDLLADRTDKTIVLTCISGGASALAVSPSAWRNLIELLANPTISKETQQLIQQAISSQSNLRWRGYANDLRMINTDENIPLAVVQAIGISLLGSGLPIDKINAVRSRIDRLKSGGLVESVKGGKVIGLILSDVIGDPIEAIGSGLTNHPKADNFLVGNNRQACEAVAQAAIDLGYTAHIVTTELNGEAQIRGAEIVREIITHPPKTVSIYGGETTVTLPENCNGKGGRNQELGLAAAIELARHNTSAWVITLATDGTDGPTDAAGVTVNEMTVDKALKLGLDPQLALDEHNSYPFFDRLGDLHLIGATGTNVADITIAIRN
jgi:glycerate 2-kinase